MTRKKMRLALGSKNPIKKEALEETIRAYEMFSNASVITRDVCTGLPEQPLTLIQTINGAVSRADKAYKNCDYSFGIESGFMDLLHKHNTYMEITVCAAYDGNKFSLGFSSAFECPPRVMDFVLHQKKDLSEAAKLAGLTTKEKVGEAEGILGVLTNGRITRKDYTKQAIMMALIQIENKELYPW